MRTWLALLMACLALGLVAAGCGGDDDDDEGGEAATTEQPADTATTPKATGETVEIEAKDVEFIPEDITVARGTRVVWNNADAFAHTVTKDSGPGPEFDEQLDAKGEVELTFDTPGKIEYVCTIHPGQDGTVTVE